MRKLEKESRTLLLGTTIVCVLSLLFAFGISSVLTENFQSSLVNHDYGVAGYLLNHDDAFVLSAFTDEKGEEDILCGLNALSLLGYHEAAPIRLLPAVSAYRNKVLLSLGGLLLFVFVAIYVFLFLYLRRQRKSRFSQDTQGIGLGLPLAKTIVELHGGTISVASRLHAGTTFTLSFFHLTNE